MSTVDDIRAGLYDRPEDAQHYADQVVTAVVAPIIGTQDVYVSVLLDRKTAATTTTNVRPLLTYTTKSRS